MTTYLGRFLRLFALPEEEVRQLEEWVPPPGYTMWSETKDILRETTELTVQKATLTAERIATSAAGIAEARARSRAERLNADVESVIRDIPASFVPNEIDPVAGAVELAENFVGELQPGFSDSEADLPTAIRRHRPRSLARKFHETVLSMQLPSEEWLVAQGLDLLCARTTVKRALGVLLRLDSGVKVLRRTPLKSKSGACFSRFALLVHGSELEVVPELFAKLALFAAFRDRDHALLLTLKGHSITWAKEHDVAYLDMLPCVFGSVLLAWVPGEMEEACVAVTANPVVQERLGLIRHWRVGVPLHQLGLASWWSPLYHLRNLAGLSVPARIHVA